jgi:hypothetical protein
LATDTATRRAWSATFFACVFALGAPAWAQEEPSSGDVAAARALGQEGVKLADSGNCQEAVDKLAKAEKLYHAPTTLVRLGECQVQLGKLVEGTENLIRVTREQLPPNAPPVFVQAQERAKRVLGEARPKIAKLRLTVAVPPDSQLLVRIDGEPISIASLGTYRPMDPGEHSIDATATGYKPVSTKIRLAEGASDAIALKLDQDPASAVKLAPAQIAKPSAISPYSPPPAEPPPREPNHSTAYAALGVGGVGLATGAIFGLMAMAKKNELERACPNKVCVDNQNDKIEAGKTFGIVSTVGFVVGGVGLATGAILYLAQGTRKTAGSRRGVTPWVGIGGAGLSGRF